ncbi:MAG: thermonuclease family protein [bacterium]|nr:thermonuclease family protein [bacterium]
MPKINAEEIRKLFEGKKKFFTIPMAIILGLGLLPITIGLGIGYLAYKKIPNTTQRNVALGVIALVTLGATFAWFNMSSTEPEPQPSQQTTQSNETKEKAKIENVFKVTKVVDGDTIEIEGGKHVRYIGIDTPETVDPRKEVQCFGQEASDKNKEMVEGKEVRLEKDVSETDKYDRLLRYVYVGDTFVNDSLVRQGYARASSYPPDVKHQDQFTEAEKEARENDRGLWSECEKKEEAAPPTTTPPPTTSGNCDPSYPDVCIPKYPPDLDCGDITYRKFKVLPPDPHGFDGKDNDGVGCES